MSDPLQPSSREGVSDLTKTKERFGTFGHTTRCDQRCQNVPSKKKLFFKLLPKIDFFQKIDFFDLKMDF